MATDTATSESEQAQATEILRATPLPPPEVLRIECEIAENSEQSDALWIIITVSAKKMRTRAAIRRVNTFIGDLQQRIIDGGLKRFPYIRVEEA